MKATGKMSIALAVSIFGLFAMAGCATLVPAASKVQEIKNRGVLVVAAKKDESPTGQHRDVAHFQKRDFEISLAKAIAKNLLGDESKVEVKMLPLADRIPAVERNEVDLTISAVGITEELKNRVNFSQPYAFETLTLMARKGAGFKTLEDLKGQVVAATVEGGRNFGDDVERIARDKVLPITTRSFGDFEQAADAVQAGQLPAVAHRGINILVYMAQKPGVFETFGGMLSREDYGIAVKKGNDDLLELVNAVIGELKKSGEIKQLAEKAQFPAAHISP